MPGLEVAYERFLDRVDEETADPDWNVRHHPAREVLDRYPPSFGEWVGLLNRFWRLKQAGYPLDKRDLSWIDWQALALLDRFCQNPSSFGEEGD